MTPTHQQLASSLPDGRGDRGGLARRYPAVVYACVHPCIIEGERCFVHERDLQQRDPRVYSGLARLARKKGFRLQEDRRRQNLRLGTNRRSRWAIILVVVLSSVSGADVRASEVGNSSLSTPLHSACRASETKLLSRSSSPGTRLCLRGPYGTAGVRVRCDESASWIGTPLGSPGSRGSDDGANRLSYETHGDPLAVRRDQRACPQSSAERTHQAPDRPYERVSVLGLIPLSSQIQCHSGTAAEGSESSEARHFDAGVTPQPGAFERIRDLLHARYQAKPDDPDYFKPDLDRIAAYYSRFPEVLQLLSSLEGKAWHLSYGKNTWVTKATGTRVSVSQATVVFDPRMAAQLRFRKACSGNRRCTASPADALLHEFLHVRAMLLDSKRFIAQGGMAGALYPYTHEAEVISAENALYSAMARLDGLARPQRSRHKHMGKLVKASCAVCIN